MKTIKFIISLVLLSDSTIAQLSFLPIERVDSVMAIQPKPLLILLSTDWCQYCQLQKHQLAKNEEFKSKRTLFHYVEFDAEHNKPVRFNAHMYNYKPRGSRTGIHDLALTLNGSGAIAFPTWVLLDPDYQVIFRHNGVLSATQIRELIKAMEQQIVTSSIY